MGIYVLLSLLTQGNVTAIDATTNCHHLHSPQQSLFYKMVHSFSVAIFLTVLASLIFFYSSVSRRLLQQRELASSTSRKLARSRRNMLVLVVVFCVCFVPYHLVRLPYAFSRSSLGSWSQCLFYLKELTVMLSTLNVCLDPLIYFIFCQAFRARMSLGKKTFSSTHVPTQAANAERRTSDGWLGSVRTVRRQSTKIQQH